MGYGRWTADTYTSYVASTSYNTRSLKEVFSNTSVPKALDPRNIVLRESRDSEINPASTPIILALDVTGSMGQYAGLIAKEALPELMTRILEDKPVTDPHLMFMGVDDVHSTGHGALQASQFEADIRILEQLREIWLVGRGGGNSSESYDLPWIFAATKTSIDCMTRRGKKGFLFTMGDECAPYENVSPREQELVFGSGQYEYLTPAQSLAMAKKSYNVFHIVIEQGNHFRCHAADVERTWTDLMGNNVLFLRDFKDLTELVISTMRICNGADMQEVIAESKNPQSLKHAFKNSLKIMQG